MKYLWVGVCRDEYLNKEFIANGGQLYSGHIANDSLFSGFIENGVSFDSINGKGIKHYPVYKQLFLRRHKWHDKDSMHVSVGYLNGKYSRILTRIPAMRREAKKWIKKYFGERVVVFIYGLSSPGISITKIIKRYNPNAVICLIIPDLPEYKDLNASCIKRVLKKVESFYIDRYLNSVDYFFPFAEKMAAYLKLPDNHWMVMEGSISADDIKRSSSSIERKKAIMYAGVCNIDFGIDILLEAFSNIQDKDAELWLAGTGNAQALIKEYAERDSRIKYYGYIPHNNVLELELRASGVINLRNPNQTVSQYAFPSKIFEYMLSACPVLSFKVEGIPVEYYDYLQVMDQPTVDCVSESISKVLGMSTEERNAIGMKAREFIIREKSNIKQTERMIRFLTKRGVL